ncbi:hypothetical protein ATEIFO6365_0006040800 [Aspergillus terreus]|uniref:Uncharacterized protein n=1 Tax=Aspergillus terreus TaxID=33178 RepID=A0A5M3YWT2_ASPTE|nr:hypothetical protein ATETN484_0005040600 [Aspergillus terreus]GFF17071.1 hypothetical protein ATEIFO6365_0006040800 [Aspergillus terreus]
MVNSRPSTVRRRLQELWETLASTERERTDDDLLLAWGIHREVLNLEQPPDTSSASDPQILLSVLPQATLDKHLIDRVQYQEGPLKGCLVFKDYSPHSRRGASHLGRGPRHVQDFVHDWACNAARVGLPCLGPRELEMAILDLADKIGWWDVSIPHPFLLDKPFVLIAPSRARHTRCDTGPILEWRDRVENDVSTFAHLTIFAVQHSIGNDASMQMGELKAIILGMMNRSTQLNLPEDKQEAAFEDRGEWLKQYPLAFPKERRFPLLLVTFVAPQHGRIFYASMDGQRLVIRQSKLYSFEREATAPLDLFTRWIMYTPLRED